MPFLLNPHRDNGFRGLFTGAEYASVQAFFAERPELSPTPLRTLPRAAEALGLASVHAKDESARFGLNAFKILGVSYAVHTLGADRISGGLVCATAGNHGRAVARVARDAGVACTVFVPALRTTNPIERRTRGARVDAMRQDGARVIEVDGTYEDAVAQAAAHGERSGGTIVSDTSWPGYDEIPRLIMAGYTHLFEEASTAWTEPPDVVLVQGGVGGLVCAAASWLAWRFGPERPRLVACEPENAACLLASAGEGRAVTITSSLDTIMAGLRCAEPSPLAWPAIAAGVDAFMTVPDAQVEAALAALSAEGILAGPSGACSMAALQQLATAEPLDPLREALRLDTSTRALVVVTEGA